MHPVNRLLGFAGGGEDGARVVLEEAQPGCHVGGVIGPGMMGDAQIRQDEGSGQFGGGFFDRQPIALEPFLEVPVEPVLCASGVSCFMY